MRRVQTIVVERLEPRAAERFGKALDFSGAQPTGAGEWWQCWEGCANLSAGRQWAGFVKTAAGWPVIDEMEREPGTEMIIPVSGAIVQVVALGKLGEDKETRPDPGTAKAFLMEPGQALVMAPGVWHAAAFGLEGEASYFYIAERRKAEESEGRMGWVEFACGGRLKPAPPVSHGHRR